MIKIGMHLRSSPSILLNSEYKTSHPVSVGISGNSGPSSRVDRIFCSKNGFFSSDSGFLPEKMKENNVEQGLLKPLWDDGYGSQTVNNYMEAVKDMIKSDGGPPRWFCPIESGPPLKNSPVLLYLPGIDGLGMGMLSHHKALGKVFQVRCLHIPVYDRTPYKGLLKFVENAVRAEHALYPNIPIYLVGDSFGGCLALSIAASNPMIDLVLILVNPATSFNRSQLQTLLPFIESFPEEVQAVLPYLLATTLGDPIKMMKVMSTKKELNSPTKDIGKLILEKSAFLTGVSRIADIFPKQTLIWKLKLLKSGAAFSNSRLHAVKCEVLILAGGKDSMFPSKDEAHRLSELLKNSSVRLFKDGSHTLLMEDGINLLTVLKGMHLYRRSKTRDAITDFVPPSKYEFHKFFDQQMGFFRAATGPVVLSTLGDGRIIKGLKGIPDQGPVLLVGYHMLFGSEITTIAEEFLKEKNVMIHGLAHPIVFSKDFKDPLLDNSKFDWLKVFGALPVSAKNLYKLLSTKSYVLLYPGGVREALHRKGEQYKLFWPKEPEFVRMAARYGAKIVPFGAIGEDDIFEIFFDYNEMMSIPQAKEMIERKNKNIAKVRGEVEGEVSKQDFFMPGFYPKLPGRFYFLFGKPVETKGREEEVLRSKNGAKELYLQIKGEVERNMAYLIKKRDEDPYRNLLSRLWYCLVSAPDQEPPTFDPY